MLKGKVMEWVFGRLSGRGGRILAKGLFLGREWKDSEILEGWWCGEDSLVEAFPELYSIASAEDAWVDLMWVQVGEVGC